MQHSSISVDTKNFNNFRDDITGINQAATGIAQTVSLQDYGGMDDPGDDFARRQEIFLFSNTPKPPPRTAGGFSPEVNRSFPILMR
jgi:hypothetical protein